MMTSDVVREKLQTLHNPPTSANKVISLLKSELARPVSRKPATVTASEALRLWRTRQQNTKITNARIQGLEDLLTQLGKLAPQRKVDQFGFIGPKTAITVFFARNDGMYLGSAILSKNLSR